ncbi:acyltransferase family protein [Leptospira sp. WS92.C1]
MRDYFLNIFRYDEREIAPLNGLRTFGFLMVVAGHMYRPLQSQILDPNQYIRHFFDNGSLYLDLFFVMSGFLIAAPLLKELKVNNTIHWKNFYIKRILRIFPSYYLFLAIQYFILYPSFIKSAPPLVAEQLVAFRSKIWVDIFYLSDYIRGTMFHGWSLSLEEQFYIFFPMFLLFVFKFIPDKFKLSSLFFLAILPLVYRIYFEINVILVSGAGNEIELYNNNIYYPFHGHIDSIFYGIIFAYIFVYKKIWLDKLIGLGKITTLLHSFVWIILISYIFLIDEFEPGLTQAFRFTTASILWGLIQAFCLRKEDPIAKLFSWKFFSVTSKLTYCAYLVHVVIMVPLSRRLIFMDKKVYSYEFFLYVIPVGIVIFLVAYVLHLVSERPFMYVRDRLLKKT